MIHLSERFNVPKEDTVAKYETRKQTWVGKQSTLERKQRRREKYQTTQLTDHKGYRARILGGAR